MTDPFDALREPAVPTNPDPDFAASLRARIERALAAPGQQVAVDLRQRLVVERQQPGIGRRCHRARSRAAHVLSSSGRRVFRRLHPDFLPTAGPG